MSTYTASTAFQSVGIDPVALSRLRHLDITGRVHFEGPSYVTNADGPILKCRCHIEGRGRLWVAGKGLKLDFFDKLSAKEARFFFLMTKISLSFYNRFLWRKSISGQGSTIPIF